MSTHVHVTGQTFPHRDQLKDWGGRWNSDAQRWEIPKRHADKARQLSGCMVTEPPKIVEPWIDPTAQIEAPKQSDMEMLAEILEALANRKEKPVHGSTAPIIYGSNPQYVNNFKDRNPIAHYGFANLAEMVDFVDQTPAERRSGIYDAGWDTARASWYGSPNMQAALDTARNGWQEGVTEARQIVEQFGALHATQRRRKHTLAGGSVSVGRMLAGNPMHMVKRPHLPGRRVLTLFVENCASAGIHASTLIKRAAVIGAMVDLVEQNGYSCEIVSVSVTRYRSNRPAYQLTVNVKNAGERLNLDDLIFTLGHPSFLRRMAFACVTNCDALRDIYGYQGQVCDAFNQTRKNEFYIRRMDKNTVDVEEIFDIVKPDGFPLEFKGDDD